MSPRRILFIAEGQLGDLLLLTPALRATHRSFPSASITLLIVDRRAPATGIPHPACPVTGPLAADADTPISTNPHVHRIFRLDREFLRSLRGLPRMRAELAVLRFLWRERFDTVICTFPEDRFAIYGFASGAAVRVGQRGQAFRRLLNVRPDIRKERDGVRTYYCDLVRAIGASDESDRTEYSVPADARRWARETLRRCKVERGDRLVLIHPGATGDYKIWPPERFAELADRLHRLTRVRVILCSGSLDARPVGEIVAAARFKPVVIETAGNIARLAALMEQSHLCITNDSGPRHLAVSVGAPTLALFRHHHDREWMVYDEGPFCATLQGAGTCADCPLGECRDLIPPGMRYGSMCMRLIDVDDVFAQAKAMLHRAHSSKKSFPSSSIS